MCGRGLAVDWRYADVASPPNSYKPVIIIRATRRRLRRRLWFRRLIGFVLFRTSKLR